MQGQTCSTQLICRDRHAVHNSCRDRHAVHNSCRDGHAVHNSCKDMQYTTHARTCSSTRTDIHYSFKCPNVNGNVATSTEMSQRQQKCRNVNGKCRNVETVYTIIIIQLNKVHSSCKHTGADMQYTLNSCHASMQGQTCSTYTPHASMQLPRLHPAQCICR